VSITCAMRGRGAVGWARFAEASEDEPGKWHTSCARHVRVVRQRSWRNGQRDGVGGLHDLVVHRRLDVATRAEVLKTNNERGGESSASVSARHGSVLVLLTFMRSSERGHVHVQCEMQYWQGVAVGCDGSRSRHHS
jgi:hypothetical protein